jgi:chromosome partitioning protein
MAFIIGLVSQKGGVGKSTLARLIAREAATGELTVKIADLDTQQQTCTRWAARRIEQGIIPEIEVQPVGNVARVIRDETPRYDLYIFDGAPQASKQTLEVARHCDLVIIPASESLEDREPAVVLANDLYSKNIPAERIAFALCLVGSSAKQIQEAKRYFAKTPYMLLDGTIPAKDSFKRVLAQGRAPTETPYKHLSGQADRLAQSIIDAIATTQETRKEAS